MFNVIDPEFPFPVAVPVQVPTKLVPWSRAFVNPPQEAATYATETNIDNLTAKRKGVTTD